MTWSSTASQHRTSDPRRGGPKPSSIARATDRRAAYAPSNGRPTDAASASGDGVTARRDLFTTNPMSAPASRSARQQGARAGHGSHVVGTEEYDDVGHRQRGAWPPRRAARKVDDDVTERPRGRRDHRLHRSRRHATVATGPRDQDRTVTPRCSGSASRKVDAVIRPSVSATSGHRSPSTCSLPIGQLDAAAHGSASTRKVGRAACRPDRKGGGERRGADSPACPDDGHRARHGRDPLRRRPASPRGAPGRRADRRRSRRRSITASAPDAGVVAWRVGDHGDVVTTRQGTSVGNVCDGVVPDEHAAGAAPLGACLAPRHRRRVESRRRPRTATGYARAARRRP